jgi:hypothetical protein
MRRHLPALGRVARVAEDLREQRHHRVAPQQHGARLAQRREDPIAGFQRIRAADARGLLPGRAAVKADSPLALQRLHSLVHGANAQHHPVQLDELGVGQRVRLSIVAQ